MAVSSRGMDMRDKRPSVMWRITHVWLDSDPAWAILTVIHHRLVKAVALFWSPQVGIICCSNLGEKSFNVIKCLLTADWKQWDSGSSKDGKVLVIASWGQRNFNRTIRSYYWQLVFACQCHCSMQQHCEVLFGLFCCTVFSLTALTLGNEATIMAP